ncbi:MAG: DNA polymerase IV [Chitinispirillaceae bacterium]|nr:DNA polymerase IV [Chitinispirillaceae bacterium]
MSPAMEPASRTIFHIDMDAFFASVEQRDHPQYRNKPVIVGAQPGGRGVVSAASYEARAYGIHSAMPINEAFGRCPHGIFVRPRISVYEEVSEALMQLFSTFSPKLEQISVDEAFLDMTGSERLFGPPLQTARRIAATVRSKQRLTASIGIAPNKFCAKIASDINKPHGITVCPDDPEEIVAWLAPMPVGKIWGAGKKTVQELNRMGIQTIGDMRRISLEKLINRFGRQGAALYHLSRGIDDRPVGVDAPCKSISREHTFSADSRNPDQWRETLFILIQDVSTRARRYHLKGSTVFITWRRPDFTRHTRRKTLRQQTNVAKLIFEDALALLNEVNEPSLRLLGVGITGLGAALQTDLFAKEGVMRRWEASEQAMDILADRFGSKTIKKGSELRKRLT